MNQEVLHWRDLLTQLRHEATYEAWQNFVAPAGKNEGTALIYASMYGPAVIHRKLFNAFLLACLQEPLDRAESALEEVTQAARGLRFSSKPTQRLLARKHLRSVYQHSIADLHRMLPGVVDLFHTLFRNYLGDPSPVQSSVDEIMSQARDCSNTNQRGRTMELVALAGSQSLRGPQMWAGWSAEGDSEFQYWVLSLWTQLESQLTCGIVPLDVVAVERTRSDERARQVMALLSVDQTDKRKEFVQILSDDPAKVEELIRDLEELHDRDDPLTDSEIDQLDADEYRRLGESALAVLDMYVSTSGYELDNETVEDAEVAHDLALTASAALGVLRYRTSGSIRLLIECVTGDLEDEFELIDNAIWALQQMGNAAITAARQVVTYSSDREAVANSLLVMGGAGRGDPAMFDELAAGFTRTSWADGRIRYVTPIASTNDPRAADMLVPRLGDPDLDPEDAMLVLEAMDRLNIKYSVDNDEGDVTVEGYGTYSEIAPDTSREEVSKLVSDALSRATYNNTYLGNDQADEEETTWEDRDLEPPKTDYRQVVQQPARYPKVGRNDPCPCGSGKKYKYCHGKVP